MQNKIEVYNVSNYEIIGILNSNYILPTGAHFIINNAEYVVVEYLLIDYDINTLKMLVRKLDSNERHYLHKIYWKGNNMATNLYFSKEKINTLIKMENLIMKYSKKIFGKNKDRIVVIKWFNGEMTEISYDDYMEFNNIIEKLISVREEKIKKNGIYKSKKRKENKMYARSKREIIAHKKAMLNFVSNEKKY